MSGPVRFHPIVFSLVYLALTGVACVPMFTRPDSPLSGVLAVILTLPWSAVLGIPIALLEPDLLRDLPGVCFLIAAGALLNAMVLLWLVSTRGRRRTGHEA